MAVAVAARPTPLAQNTIYTLTVDNVRDRAATPNTIVPNSQRTFTITPTPLPIAMVKPSLNLRAN